MSVSKRLRYEVLRRDNHACRYCGHSAPEVQLAVDHVVPVALGGRDDPSNLVAACRDCNAGKSASSPDAPLVADVQADALRWATAMEAANQFRDAELEQIQAMVDHFDAIWTKYWYGVQDAPLDQRAYAPRPRDWRSSVTRFVQSGLTIPFFGEAARTTFMERAIALDQAWRYFCGICWRELDLRRQVAMDILAADSVPDGHV